ncbi:hypothetical protein SAMN05661080_00529 [Modestobacter sp. DSM 44400]|nr:hypothetical protein SAMN05661080_00529 [Modestobacter sp. DSM 44400]
MVSAPAVPVRRVNLVVEIVRGCSVIAKLDFERPVRSPTTGTWCGQWRSTDVIGTTAANASCSCCVVTKPSTGALPHRPP